jgi:hypothetical protein
MYKFCGCRGCREGLHRAKGDNYTVKRVAKRFRKNTKLALKQGKYEDVVKYVSVPYTD